MSIETPITMMYSLTFLINRFQRNKMSAASKGNIYELRKENISVVLEVIVVRRGGALFKMMDF